MRLDAGQPGEATEPMEPMEPRYDAPLSDEKTPRRCRRAGLTFVNEASVVRPRLA